MLKIERDKLLVAAVLIVIISIDMTNTSMLAPILPRIPNIILFLGVVFLAVRFLYQALFFDISSLCPFLVSGRLSRIL